jgi:uncharacterized protein YnzC (UPF0291/DUF896 family)
MEYLAKNKNGRLSKEELEEQRKIREEIHKRWEEIDFVKDLLQTGFDETISILYEQDCRNEES